MTEPHTNVTYPRVEFREYDPDRVPFRPSWQTAIPAVEDWLTRLDDAPFDAHVKDANGSWHVTATAEDGALRWRVELANHHGWFLSAEARRREDTPVTGPA
jgi:hypothetical protein